MANCKNQKYVGRDVVLEYVIGCADTLPLESEWNKFGALRAKEFTLEWETTDATADDSVGALRENLATFQTLSISGDGTCKASGEGAENLVVLTKHVAKPEATGGQPTAWIRMTFPDLTFVAFMIVTNMSRSAPHDDVTTFTFEASATASDYGLLVEDTPDANAADPVSVDVVPDTITLTVGEAFTAQAVVMPPGATQSVRWSSGAAAVATVGVMDGRIQSVAPGSTTIKAQATADAGVSADIALTVIPQVQGINVSPSSVSVVEGATQAITASVSPAGASPGLKYVSANPSVATVSSSGMVEGITAGETVVTVSSVKRPGVVVSVPVTVTEM